MEFGQVAAGQRVAVRSAILVLLGLSVFPIFQRPPQDSFPFSTYPMFAGRKPTTLRISQVLGRREQAQPTPMPPLIAAGNREVLQAKGVIEDAVRLGQADRLCREAAYRAKQDAWGAQFSELLVATSEFNTVTYFENGRAPARRQVHARCSLSGQP